MNKRLSFVDDWNSPISESLEDEDTYPNSPSDSEMNEGGEFGYTSMGEQANSDNTAQRAVEKRLPNPKERSTTSRKVKTLFKRIGIPRNHISKKVARLLKSRPKFLEPFMKAYVDAKRHLIKAKNAQVDELADTDGPVLTETQKSRKKGLQQKHQVKRSFPELEGAISSSEMEIADALFDETGLDHFRDAPKLVQTAVSKLSVKNVPKAEEPLDDGVEADDWGSEEPSTADSSNEQQLAVDSSSADSDYGSRILHGETESAFSL